MIHIGEEEAWRGFGITIVARIVGTNGKTSGRLCATMIVRNAALGT
jgi:hypothetical protein